MLGDSGAPPSGKTNVKILLWCFFTLLSISSDITPRVTLPASTQRVPYYLENKPAGLFNGEMWAARVRGWVR
jgi:hypothetical protein